MRTKNSFFNLITSIIPFAVFVILGFLKVKVWQAKMDENIYALNQLFFQLFAYVSIAEAGIGAIIQKKYYSLLIDKDTESICKYYTLSKKMLRKICYIIFTAGIVLSFFLTYLAKGNTLSLFYMQEIFVLFLIKSLVEYFMFSPRFLLTADQKLYKMNLQNYAYKIAETVMEIILIYVGVSYLLVLVCSIVLRIIMNLRLNRIVFKEYPWLKEIKPDKDMSLKGMSDIFIFKIISVVQENVGALLISAFINPISVIIYSNYKYITKYLNDFIYQSGVAITASLGNLVNEKNDDNRALETFGEITTLYYFTASFFTLALAFCINPFISIWVGKNKVLDNISLLCLLFVFFHSVARRPLYIIKDVMVLYKELQLNSAIEAVVTVILSLILIKLNWGIKGVLIAAAASPVLVSFIYMPKVVYKKAFNCKPWNDLLKYAFNIAIIIIIQGIGTLMPFRVSDNGFVMWFITSCVAALILLVLLGIIYFCTFKSFRKLLETGKYTLQSIIKNKNQ